MKSCSSKIEKYPDFVAGFNKRSNVNLTSSEVSGWPSWNLTPSPASVNVMSTPLRRRPNSSPDLGAIRARSACVRDQCVKQEQCDALRVHDRG